MNMYLHEVKSYWKSLLIWSISIILLVYIGSVEFNSFATSGQDVSAMMDKLPQSIKAIFGMSTLDLSTANGYYGVIFNYLLLMAAIHSVLLGANILAKEEQEKTVEFLLVKPVSRHGVIVAKMTAAVSLVLLLNIVSFLGGLYFVSQFESANFDTSLIVTCHIAMLLLQLIFLSLGLMIAGINRQARSAANIATSVMLGTYFLAILIGLSDKISVLKYVTPFQYFEVGALFGSGSIEAKYGILSVGIIISCTVAAFVGYQKRDMRV